jgi:PKD repeat protein
MMARSSRIVALLVVCIFFIAPVIAQDNPYRHTGDITEKDVAVNVESGIAKVSDSSKVTFSGAEYTHTLGRVSIRMKPLMDGVNEGITSMGNTHISGVKSQVKYSVYRDVIKEEITLKSPETVRYSYDIWLSDWVMKIPNETKLQKIPGLNKSEIRSHFLKKEVMNYARDSTIEIQPDRWGNLVVYVNSKDVVIMPRPYAIDAAGKRFELGFNLDKKNKIITITGDLTSAQYPIIIDPTERVTNGNFETGDLSGWNYDPDDYEWFWESFVANEPYPDGPLYFVGVCGGPDGRKGIWQSIDLTNVDKLTFTTMLYLYTFDGDHPYFSVYIDNNEVLHVGEAWDEFNDYEINVSNYSGMHTVYFQVNGMGTTAEYFINNISAIVPDVPPLPVADFTATPITGTAPINVTFTDISTGSPTNWSWSFGDGDMSTQQNPSHIYETAGMYNVSLTAANAAGSNTTVKEGYIIVTDGGPVQATFYVYAEGSGMYPPRYDKLVEANKTPKEIYEFLDGQSGAASVDPNVHWVGRGLYLDSDSNESHWNYYEQAGSYADNADFSVFAGHGWNDRIIFGTQDTDTDLYRENMKFGGNRAKWVTLFACDVLNQTYHDNWTSVFNGLHILNGFDTDALLYEGQGTTYAQILTGNGGGYDRKPIRNAWRLMLQESINKEYISGAYMWADPCGSDYLPGFGNYSSAATENVSGIHYGNFTCITS